MPDFTTQPNSPPTQAQVDAPVANFGATFRRHKISVTKVKVRGEARWRVRWFEAGRIFRRFFTGRDAAEALGAKLRGEVLPRKHRLLNLPPDAQDGLLRIYGEAKRLGVALDTIPSLLSSNGKPATGKAIADVLDELLAAKRNAGRATSYLASLGQKVKQFIAGRERMPVDRFTVREVEAFMDTKAIRHRTTIRSRLSTLFLFSIRRGYRPDNPCDRLEPISLPHETPSILTVDEVEKCLGWFRVHPRALAWFCLSAFAGLRPDEARKTRWADIDFSEGWVRVDAQTTKVKMRRVVYPHPMAMSWLKTAKRLKSELPLTVKQKVVEQIALRRVLGWPAWKQDVTRHTAISMLVASGMSMDKVAGETGTSARMVANHYRALVTRQDAAKYWQIRP